MLSRIAKPSTLTIIIIAVVIVGYVVIFVTTIFGDSNQIHRLATEVTAARMQIEILKKSLVTAQNELRSIKHRQEKTEKPVELENKSVKQSPVSPDSTLPPAQGYSVRHGVIILGMHRSGTSLVGGLINKMGLKTGGPLIQAAEDNAKGFFERIDVVLQNDYLMQKQGVHYAFHTYKYDALTGLKHILNDDGSLFKEGKRGLKFLNDKSNYPWMLKDPRLCITFRTWLPLLNFIPAILFTYRHPLDVALSLHKREFERFEIPRGLRMWYVYNRRAVQQSEDLCRVITSHHLVMTQPEVEFTRMYNELRACGIDVPHKLTSDEVASFIDIKLQHGQSTLKDKVCDEDVSTIQPPQTWQPTNDNQLKLYREVMRVYCAMENRSAFEKGFQWDDSIQDG